MYETGDSNIKCIKHASDSQITCFILFVGHTFYIDTYNCIYIMWHESRSKTLYRDKWDYWEKVEQEKEGHGCMGRVVSTCDLYLY